MKIGLLIFIALLFPTSSFALNNCEDELISVEAESVSSEYMQAYREILTIYLSASERAERELLLNHFRNIALSESATLTDFFHIEGMPSSPPTIHTQGALDYFLEYLPSDLELQEDLLANLRSYWIETASKLEENISEIETVETQQILLREYEDLPVLPSRAQPIFSHDGKRIGLISEDRFPNSKLEIWDLPRRALTSFSLQRGERIDHFSFSKDGKYLSISSDTGILEIFNLESHQRVLRYSSFKGFFGRGLTLQSQFSQSSRFLVAWTQKRAVVFDVASGEIVRDLQISNFFVNLIDRHRAAPMISSVDISPDDSSILIYTVSNANSLSVKIWPLKTESGWNRFFSYFKNPAPSLNLSVSHSDHDIMPTFYDNNSFFNATSKDISLRDKDTGQIIRELKRTDRGPIRLATLSADRQTLITQEYSFNSNIEEDSESSDTQPEDEDTMLIRLYPLSNLQRTVEIPTEEAVKKFLQTPDSNYLLATSNTEVLIFNIETGQSQGRFSADSSRRIYDITITPDFKKIVVALKGIDSAYFQIRIFDIERLKRSGFISPEFLAEVAP